MKNIFLILALATAVTLGFPVPEEENESKIGCGICQLGIKILETMLKSDPKTLEKLGTYLQKACEGIPVQKDKEFCMDFVKNHIKEIMKELIDDPKMAPKKVCQAIGACPK